MTDPVEIINRFTEYSPHKGEEPLPLPIPGHWFRKICALADRIAAAENERDELRAENKRLTDANIALRTELENVKKMWRDTIDRQRLPETARRRFRLTCKHEPEWGPGDSKRLGKCKLALENYGDREAVQLSRFTNPDEVITFEGERVMNCTGWEPKEGDK